MRPLRIHILALFESQTSLAGDSDINIIKFITSSATLIHLSRLKLVGNTLHFEPDGCVLRMERNLLSLQNVYKFFVFGVGPEGIASHKTST